MEHRLKDIAFYVQKHITPCMVVITSLVFRDKPLGTPASVKWVYYSTTYFTKILFLLVTGVPYIICHNCITYVVGLLLIELIHAWLLLDKVHTWGTRSQRDRLCPCYRSRLCPYHALAKIAAFRRLNQKVVHKMVSVCNFVTKLIHFISVMPQQHFVTKRQYSERN